MNEEPSATSDEPAEPSVFGNLPRTRPGSRSPRRDEAAAKAEARRPAGENAEAPAPDLDPAADAEEALAASRPEPDPLELPNPEAGPQQPDGGDDGGGMEELAWAGVAAAAEAATLGVRLANRALESLRGDSDSERS